MARMIDDLKTGRKIGMGLPTVPIRDDAMVFDIGNVAQYYYIDSTQEFWDLSKDFGVVAPPAPVFWMEFVHPAQVNGMYGLIDSLRAGAGVAISMQAERSGIAAPWHYKFDVIEHGRGNRFPDLLGSGSFDVGANGSLIERDGGWMRIEPSAGAMDAIKTRAKDIAAKARELHGEDLSADVSDEARALRWLTNSIRVSVEVALLALSFLNCKNIEIEVNDAPAKIQQRRARDGKTPLTRFSRIKITPMKEFVRKQKGMGTHSSPSLHIVRGQFRDYRANGLFGKHHGVFYFDTHSRGSAEQGTVTQEREILLDE